MNHVKSIELYNEAKEKIPAGVNSPVRAFRSVGGTPIFMKEGQGSRITDEDDNTYIDFCMSWGPLILGHADADVVKAVQDTAVLGTSFGTPHRNEVELASLVVDAFPSIERVRFVNSGTEATMSAIRLARGCTGKSKIIKFDGCYHGHADFLLVAAGSGLATFGTPDSSGVTEGNARDTIVLPYNNLEALEEYLEKEGKTVAAIIMEPVPCNYGMIKPKEGYLKAIRNLCDTYGIILIFDEVINGFRLAKGGAQEYFGIEADLTTLGKIIGGGLPVGAYGGKKIIMDCIAPDGPVYQAGTLSGNPLAMAAGIATLKKLISQGYGALEEICAYFNEKMGAILDAYQGKVLFQQLESIFTISFTNGNSIESLDDVKSADMKLYAAFHRELLERGVYLAPSGYEVGFLSSAHTKEDVDAATSTIAEALDAVFSA